MLDSLRTEKKKIDRKSCGNVLLKRRQLNVLSHFEAKFII